MDEEFKKAVVDYFTPEELVSFLELTPDDFYLVVDALEETILENIEELKEEMRHD